MAQTHPNAEEAVPDKEYLAELYKEICQNIRVTDEISFKLLGIVPLAAGVGSGALTILEKSKLLSDSYAGFVVFALSAFGVLITFGLFQWELRNIQKCRWLISRAANLEKQLLSENILPNPQFRGMVSDDDLKAIKLEQIKLASILKGIKLAHKQNYHWGKTQAEQLIYWTAIGTWFVPMGIGLHKLIQSFTQQ